ncbi:hypothetical protein I4U23_004066 [Adineta vaga]|nr:hypothetical protein I4U23_004066 [Adineta vaga]
MKLIIIVTIVLLGYVAFSEALQCFSHDLCIRHCPRLNSTVITCASDEDKCYKSALVSGVIRGCGKDRCQFQDGLASKMADICCAEDFCNGTFD